jgi:CDP-diacylglycerol--glycerol-3-phosphate 3-phosphatidyltransferase
LRFVPAVVEQGCLRGVDALSGWLVARRVSANAVTVAGTAAWVAGGFLFGAGLISAAGWLTGLSSFLDSVDGRIARATGTESRFGAFLDSTLDRVADGAALAGICYFYATNADYSSDVMLGVSLAGLLGAQLVSYVRARAEGLGIRVNEGVMQRPERVLLLCAPAAFFGMALNGAVFAAAVALLAVTSWWTVLQRVRVVASR